MFLSCSPPSSVITVLHVLANIDTYHQEKQVGYTDSYIAGNQAIPIEQAKRKK